MNPQQFSELVKDPGTLGEGTIIELENLLRQYPYCQTAQVLLTFNLLQQNHASYPAQLKKAVAYAGDRKKLKEFLEGKKQPAVVPSFTDQVPVAEIVQPVASPEPMFPEVSEMRRALDEVVIPDPLPALNIETEPDNHIEESVISFEELALASPLQDPLLEQEGKGSVIPRPLVPMASEASLEKVTQDGLLAIVRRRLAEINEETSRKEKNKGADVYVKESDKGESVPRPAAEFNKSKDELIEKFIREEPQIARPKREFFNPTASSQRSNMDEEEMVSETLAFLYAKQGNLQKAIHIYEKLSLRFSEKSRYFAAQIENLKGNATRAS